MGRYLLDSNAFVRFKVKPHTLQTQARETIEDPGNELFVSVAGLWQLAVKAARGRLKDYEHLFVGGASEILASLRESNIELLPIELVQTFAAARLPPHHGDPFDRLMIAQALERDLTVITSDRHFQYYSGVRLLAA